MQYFTNARIFTGYDWIENGTVICEDGLISGIDTFKKNYSAGGVDCGGNMLVPALIDLQLYGAGGRLFSAYPEPRSLRVLADENEKAGVATCLVTIATQPHDNIYQSIDAIKRYWQQGGEGILGMHLEGPFINPKKRGAHKEAWIHAPAEGEVKELLAAGKDVIKVVTLAPECCDPSITKMFTEAGIIVSAGHSNATYEDATRFTLQGVKLVTHLYNAMSPMHHRDTGIPGAVFESNELMASIIPDGIHVSWPALRIAKKLMGERLFFITDSVTETTIGEYQHSLNSDHYCTADGTLSGSAISLLQGVKNAVNFCGISLEESLRMASLYPARAAGIEDDYGTISEGKEASMILVNNQLEIEQVFIRV